MDLKQVLEDKASFFNKELEQFLKNGKPPTLYNAARHLPMAGGKRLRPCIAMLSCEAVSGKIKNVMPYAIALELLHNFTLVHDDIMDKSKLRRNMPSVHMKYGEPTAIMAGDLLFTKAFEAMHNLSLNLQIFKKLEYGMINCIREICEGQQLDIEFEIRNDVTEQEYLEMIRKKTAVLFQLSSEGGALSCDGSKEVVNALSEYGESLGLAFQIQDDCLDISSDEETLGKDIGNDIRNGKKTLIAVHCLNNASGENKILLSKIFGNKNATNEEVKKIYKLFIEIGSVEYAKNAAIKYNEKAKNALSVLRNSNAKEALIQLADYSIRREK